MRILCSYIILGLLISCSEDPVQIIPHEEMVLVEGGSFNFGDDEGKDEEKPAVHVHVSSFYMDQHEVTNAAFQEFVEQENYITTAEKFGASSVYRTSWELEKNINWKSGKDTLSDFGKLPVVHVSWIDAAAYCKWKNKRLPSEMEYEYALESFGQAGYNIWEGDFPDRNTAADGYVDRAPVMSFKPNEIGIYDLQGNVWEWTADHYHHNIHDILLIKEPDSAFIWEGASYDPKNLNAEQMVIKGGSFLCHDSYCCGYQSNARMPAEVNMSYYHLGFRCACDL